MRWTCSAGSSAGGWLCWSWHIWQSLQQIERSLEIMLFLFSVRDLPVNITLHLVTQRLLSFLLSTTATSFLSHLLPPSLSLWWKWTSVSLWMLSRWVTTILERKLQSEQPVSSALRVFWRWRWRAGSIIISVHQHCCASSFCQGSSPSHPCSCLCSH